jgi:hypothetical protein
MGTAGEQQVPPLAAGDKLTRAEYLWRWEARREIKNAELIGGESLWHHARSEKIVRAGHHVHRRWAGHCNVFQAIALSVVAGPQRGEVRSELF